jgi:DNA-binding beta-propeller fold protein YncE
MGVLNVWFWSTIVAGGVLTIDAPYMCRLIGIVPVDAIFPALIISKLSAEAVGVAGRGLLRLPSFARRSGWDTARVTRYGVAAAAVALLGYLTWQNFYDYYVRYMQVYPGGASTGQAVFVHQMNDKVMAEGRPAPRYYQMAAPILLWDYGTNRYLNHDTLGQDVQNVSDILPLLGDADRDAVFLAWDITEQYLPILRAYYPGGEETPFFYSPDGKSNYVFTAYRIKREQLLEGRHSVATYESAGQPTVTREESGLGTTSGLPASLKFPARATWTARLVAPGYGTYRFKLTATKHATLTIDDRQVLSVDASTTDPTREVILARGTHDVILEGDIDTAGDKVELGWLAGNVNFVPIESKYLWAGPGRGLLGELRALGGAGSDLAEDPPPDGPQPDDSTTPVFMRRVDDFLGLRATEDSASAGSAFLALWTGQLEITEPGNYRFEVYANGNAVVLIDDKPVVSLLADATDPTTESGEVELSPGSHAFKVRYNWMAGVGALEVYWTPPNGQRALMTSDVLHTGVGVWQPGAVSEPPFYQLPLGDKAAATTLAPQRLIGGSGDLLRPRGVGLDDEGNIYVGDRGHHRVVVYSREGKFIHAWGNAPPADDRRPRRGEFIDITDLAVTADGTVYVLDGGSPLLQVFDNEGIWQRTIDIGNLATYNPDGIALAADGSIYIADTGKNRVIKLPPGYDGNQPVLVLNGKLGKDGTERPNGRLRECVDVVVGGASGDSIYVADMTNRVVEFAPDGRLVQQWEIQVGGADGGTRIAPGPDGKTLYLSDPEHGRLSTLDLKTGAVRYFTGAGDEKSGLKQPSGIAVGPDGRLYVTDSARDNLKVYAPKK